MSALLVIGVITGYVWVVAYHDLRTQTIPPRLILVGIAGALFLAPFWNELGASRELWGVDGFYRAFANSLFGGLVLITFMLAIAVAAPLGLGGGDVKLSFVIGLILGWPVGAIALSVAILAGALTMIPWAIWAKTNYVVPFAPFIALGACVGLFWGAGWVEWYHSLYLE